MHAQKIGYVFQHLTKQNGLINNSVGPLCQDSRGFTWIGTQTGLQRYDGKRFVSYLADVHKPDALHTDWISAIFEDSKKRLWIGTDQEAAYLFNRGTGKFFNFNLAANHKQINGVWQFVEDSKGDIWISAHNGYFRLNNSSNQFEAMDSLLHPDGALASGISMDHAGNLWFATTAGLIELPVAGSRLFNKRYNPDQLPLFNLGKPLSSVLFDNFSNAWIGSGFERVLYRYNLVTKKISEYSFTRHTDHGSKDKQDCPIGQIFISNTGQLLVSLLSRGMAVYNYDNDNFDVIGAENNSGYGLHLNTTTESAITVVQDKKNNIWLGTDRGINIINLDKPVFTTYKNPTDSPGLLPSADVSDFLQTKDGDIYVSYYVPGGGIVRFDKSLNFKKRYLFTESVSGANQLWSLFQDKDGIIWAPNQGGTISKLDPVSEQLTVDKDSLLNGPINQVERDAENNIWLAHWNKGLVKVDKELKKATVYHAYKNADTNSLKRASCFLFDHNNIWVGTIVDGLQLLDTTSGLYTESFRLDEQDPQSISNNNITGILSYNDDTLIIATLGGINIFNKKQKKFTAVTSKNGLPNNLVQAMVLDDEHNLWTACYGGLCKINLHTLAVTTYAEDDGIINNGFNNRFYRLQDGRLMIGTTESFMIFDPAKVNEAGVAPDVTITAIKVFDKDIGADSVKKISLSHTDNTLHIEFSSLQFSSPGKLKYFYRLLGADKSWVQADETQTANYNQLQPGHYTFEVKCVTRNGIPGKNITSLDIHIIPPFWRTWWFTVLAFVVLLLCIFFIIKWREKNLKQLEAGKTKLQQLTAERYKTQLESEQISNFFTTSLFNKNNVDDVLWDVAGNLIGKLGFIDCVIYLWNEDKTKLIQKAGYGPKGSLEELKKKEFDVVPGQGVVGAVAQSGQAILIPDTSVDSRYRVDDQARLSELCVPIKYDEQLLGIIDSEHYEKDFFTRQHLQILTTIATLIAGKIRSIEDEQRLRQQKEELAAVNQQLAEVQLAALRSQMNPHFIFNALNSIKKFVIANEPGNAEKYLGKFSKLIRTILDNSQTGMVTVEKELQLLTLYLDLEQLRFGEKLSYTIEVDKNINTTGMYIPSMIVQPFVENAMLHGIMHLDNAGKISIRFLSRSDWLEITIEDNGVGRERSSMYKSPAAEPHHSIGISVAEKRLEALKKNDNTPAGINIIDLKNEAGEGCGTKVIILIPI